MALVGMSKPPYAVLGLILLACPTRPLVKGLAAGLALGAPALWALWSGLALGVAPSADAQVDPAGQLGFLLAHPLAIGPIAAHTLRAGWAHYCASFIGVLGWLDAPLPGVFYPAAFVVLALALAAGERWGAPGVWRRIPPWSAGLILAAAAGVFGALYAIWSPVGETTVNGVQGRYFLPIAVFLPLVFLDRRPLAGGSEPVVLARRAATWLALLFPLVGAWAIERAIRLRFYVEGWPG
jgi:uncharacterized membrane protein